jgi:hypothetical protein
LQGIAGKAWQAAFAAKAVLQKVLLAVVVEGKSVHL